jgi:LmbE family N-acetylglucosaminyl deacetylase
VTAGVPTATGVTTPAGLDDYLHEPLADGGRCLILSPHLDDAVLSCGALLAALADRCQITVATAFSAAGPGPHTRAARAYLRQCTAADAPALYAARRAEDRAALAQLGADHVHLGLPDALFRRREVRPALVSTLGRRIPELVHRYPTYRFDIAQGRVARADRRLVEVLRERVDSLIRDLDARLVFCPIGVGRHVDHLITRSLGETAKARVGYYSDFPYDRICSPDPAYLADHDLRRWVWPHGIADKAALIRRYETQVDALFPDGVIPAVPETYYLPRRRDVSAHPEG